MRAHRPRPNKARTHCLDCRRPVRAHGKGWVHTRYPTRGRPPVLPREGPAVIAATERWHEAEALLVAARAARADALRAMIGAGMLPVEIARATGLAGPTIDYWIRRLDLTPKPRHVTPTMAATVLKRLKRKGSPLF